MKPTQEQKLWLQDYLYHVMQYRETYEEVYDHVLTALENKPEARFFETTINEIIENDFGGLNGLLIMEKNCKGAAVGNVIKSYRSCFYSFFKFPLMSCTVVMLLARFYIHGSLYFIAGEFFAFIVFPVLLYAGNRFNENRKFGYAKSSFTDDVFKQIIFKPIMYYIRFIVLLSVSKTLLVYFIDVRAFVNINLCIHFISALIITAYTIHIICYYRLFKDELTTRMSFK